MQLTSDDHLRLLLVDSFDGIAIVEDDSPEANDPRAYLVDADNTPDWLVHPETVRRIFARHDEIRRTLDEELRRLDTRHLFESLLTMVDCKFIMLLKCLIAVYNFFNVQDAAEPGVRYSTLLDHECGKDLALAVTTLDSMLMSPAIHTPEAQHVLAGINDTMKAIFDFLASVAGGSSRKSGVAGLRETYRSFHQPHVGVPSDCAPSHRLLDAFAKVADYFADREGAWMRDRPAPTLQKPAFGLFIGRHIPNKIAAREFKCHQNTIINWNKGKGRPFDYEGPYPDTPDGRDRMMRDVELYMVNKKNNNILLKQQPPDLESMPQRYLVFNYGKLAHGKGNTVAKGGAYRKNHPNKPIDECEK